MERSAITGLLGVTLLVLACATPAATPTTSSVPSTQSTPSLAVPSVPHAGASATPAAVGSTFPPSQTAIAPGTYRWDGFERSIWVTLDAGWELGHDNPAFFDLFRGSDFPSVTFARFTNVYMDATTRSAATDAAAVVTALKARDDLTLTEPTAIELGGLQGSQFDLVTIAPRTPVFYGPAGDFRLEPEFKTRYRILDFPGGGVLVIGVHTLADAFDEAVALADPLTSTLQVAP